MPSQVVLVAVVIASLFALLCLFILWNYFLVFQPLRKSGWNIRNAPTWVSFVITFSFIASVYAIFRGRYFDAIIGALFPPAILLELNSLHRFQPFLIEPLIWSLSASIFVFIPLSITPGLFRRFSLGVAFCVFLVIFLVLAERNSRALMISEAKVIGASTFERHNFIWSLRNAPREFQFKVHALTQVDGTTYIWSYGERKFVAIKPTVWAATSHRAERIRLSK